MSLLQLPASSVLSAAHFSEVQYCLASFERVVLAIGVHCPLCWVSIRACHFMVPLLNRKENPSLLSALSED